MTQIVQAKCPYCKLVLRIPSEWLSRPMRCKHCRQTFQAKLPSSATPLPVAKPALPGSKAGIPPMAIPVENQASKHAGALPFAKPLNVPVPVANGNPFSFDESPPAASTIPLSQRPAFTPGGGGPSAGYSRRGTGWLKGALIAACVLGAAGVIFAVFGHDILNRVAAPSDSSQKAANAAGSEKKPSTPTPIPPPVKEEKNPRDKSDVSRPGDGSKPKDRSKPDGNTRSMDGVKPKDSASPKDTAKPADGIKPKDGTNPKDAAKPSDGTRPKDTANPKDGVKPKDGARPKEVIKPPKPKGPEEFPRRALLVSVCNYLFANPLPYGSKSNSTGDLAGDLVRYLHFPASQVVELSDGAKAGKASAPVKPVIQQTIAEFLARSRPMDRVMVLFSGHVADLKSGVYLVPMEGDFGDEKTLIPFSWVVEQLVKCPARQKVLVLDVFRLDMARGEERRGSGEMSEAFEAALKSFPPDIQVWTSCSPKEQSYEFDGGSLFLEAFCNVLERKGLKGIPDATDPVPMLALHAKVSEYVSSAVKDVKLKQTPQLLGKDPEKGAPYDPDKEMPPPLAIKPPPLFKDGIASKAAIQPILDEIDALPPARGAGTPSTVRLRYESMPPFPAKVIDMYKEAAQPKESAFIKAVRNAAKVLKQHSETYRETFDGKVLPIPAPVKAQVIKLQENAIGKPLFELQEAFDEIKKVEENQGAEKSKRWQANYDYVKAKLLARIIYLREYSLMMGKIRKDELPMLAPGNTGWRLASRVKLQSTDKEIKDMMSEYKKSLSALEKKHKGTPWEVLARREKDTFLGLEWKPNGRTSPN